MQARTDAAGPYRQAEPVAVPDYEKRYLAYLRGHAAADRVRHVVLGSAMVLLTLSFCILVRHPGCLRALPLVPLGIWIAYRGIVGKPFNP